MNGIIVLLNLDLEIIAKFYRFLVLQNNQKFMWPKQHVGRHMACAPFVNLGRFPFIRTGRSDWFVRKWNARVLRTVRTGSGQSGPAYGAGPLSSPGPAQNEDIAWEFYELAGSLQTCGANNRFMPKLCVLF